ncbi:MAG: drug/metabolite transporter (DMT)-like permease [Sulfurimonas sp.]|jgi:drug/metabolite transporter (DMT)-like permease
MRIRAEKLNKGVLYMLIASASLAIVSAFAKVLSDQMPTIEIVFFRNLIGVIFILGTLFRTPFAQVGGKPWLLFFRGFIGMVAMLSYFYNLAHIPLADAVTFSRTAPIFTALFAFWFLKERIGSRGWIAIFIGFLGLIMVMQPSGTLETSHIFGFLNAIGAALAFTSIRELRKYYDTRAIVLIFMSMGLIVPITSMIISHYYMNPTYDFILGVFTMPQGIEWLYLVGLGIFAYLSQFYMTKAYGESKAGIIGAVSYSVILFSIVIGVALGDELPSLLTFAGIGFIIFGGIMVIKAK